MSPRVLTDELTTVAGLASAVVEHAQSYGLDIKPICKALDIDPDIFQSLTAGSASTACAGSWRPARCSPTKRHSG